MSEKPKKKNSFKLVIIVLLLLIVVGGGAFAGMYILGNKSEAATTKTVAVTESNYSLDEFVVNLLDDGGLLYIKVTVYIGYEENEKLAVELETEKPVIRDIVNSYLRTKKNADFTSTGLVTIKSDLITRINPVLTKGKISHIYFNNIVISR
ncbi:flagellar basal body-associated FliL family protein [Clostridium algoriphilum]|uniref:flagellar basal body-associated FliL family protein n=1 Tax=Clostridium algoriphilum TaxID=198347 RepID=UPI001CF16F1D|nr:flagellar basal body-associated FliL family protein [Clostridium algoriphilum]MCB2291927.1 flagellar basal body-associated FliL family protein [Clostridium algoriphilum]